MATESPAGLERVAQGREAEIFAWDEGRVLRLLRRQGGPELVEAEVAAMTAVTAAGVPAPRVYEVVSIDGRPGVVMERVDGPDLFKVIEKKVWTLRAIARETARLHANLNLVEAPAGLPSIHERLRHRAVRTPGIVPPDLLERGLAVLETLPEGDRLCHGDFHPGNVLLRGEEPVVIDWPNATRGDPVGDFARTSLLLRVGAVPPGTPPHLRLLAAIVRKMFARVYEAEYRRLSRHDLSRFDDWLAVCLIDRLANEIPGEREELLSLLSSALRR